MKERVGDKKLTIISDVRAPRSWTQRADGLAASAAQVCSHKPAWHQHIDDDWLDDCRNRKSTWLLLCMTWIAVRLHVGASALLADTVQRACAYRSLQLTCDLRHLQPITACLHNLVIHQNVSSRLQMIFVAILQVKFFRNLCSCDIA